MPGKGRWAPGERGPGEGMAPAGAKCLASRQAGAERREGGLGRAAGMQAGGRLRGAAAWG